MNGTNNSGWFNVGEIEIYHYEIPEPGAVVMLGVGVLFGVVRRARRRQG